MARTTTKTTPSHQKPVKRAPAKKAPAQKKSIKVDYYPNRVPFYVAVVAVTVLLLLAVITAL